MTKKTKKPAIALRVLHVTGAGRKTVRVQPEGHKITIGGDTWAYKARDHRWPGKGPWDAIAVEGRDSCSSPYEETVLTSEGYNADVENNLLEQVHALSRGGKTERISWVNLGVSFLVILAVIGMTFHVGGKVDDLRHDLQVWRLEDGGGVSNDRTVVGGQQSQGNAGPQDLGQLQQQQSQPPGS